MHVCFDFKRSEPLLTCIEQGSELACPSQTPLFHRFKISGVKQQKLNPHSLTHTYQALNLEKLQQDSENRQTATFKIKLNP